MNIHENRLKPTGAKKPQGIPKSAQSKTEARPEPEDTFLNSAVEVGQDAISWLSAGLINFEDGPRAPLSDKLPKRVQSFIHKTLVEESKETENSADLKYFGKLLQAHSIAARDPEKSKEELLLDKLDSELSRMQAKPEVQAKIEDVKTKALKRYKFKKRAQEQREFISSVPFYEHLKGLKPQERKERALDELGKLRQFAPEDLLLAKVGLLKQDKAENLLSGLKETDPDKLGEFVQLSAQAAKAPAPSGPAAQILGLAFSHAEDISDAADVGQQVTQLVGQLKVKAPEAINEALSWIAHADDQGMLTTVMTVSGLLSTFQQEFHTPEEQFKLATHLVSAGGSASQISELPVLADALAGTDLATGIVATSDLLGPIGSVMSVGMNTYEAVEAVSEGETGQALSRSASALGSSLILGAALIPSPITPLLVIGGASLSIGGIVGNRVVKNRQEKALMEELGLLKQSEE